MRAMTFVRGTIGVWGSLAVLAGCASAPSPPPSPSVASPAATRLETTPRHDEWARIPRGERTLHAYVAYPESPVPVPAVLVIHENRGLTDWVRAVADRLAENGFVAVAPDMLSGAGPGGGKTSDFPSEDAAREAISGLPKEQVAADLQAAGDYALTLPAVDGRLMVAGFCWGGGRTFEFANTGRIRPDLRAAFVFYGTGPQDEAGVAGITLPVYGFYAGNDARVNATIPKTEELMRAAGQRFEPVIYQGAGHGFMRLGEGPDATAVNQLAAEEAWERWLTLLRAVEE